MATKIPYVNEAWNIAVGCTKVETGCKNCWAENGHAMRHKAYLAGKKVAKQYAKPFSKIQFLPERIEQPLHWLRPRDIFVCSQSDFFHKDIADDIRDKAMAIMASCPRHRFFIFTKRIKDAEGYFFNCNTLGCGLGDRISRGISNYANVAPIEIRKRWPLENLWLMLSISTQKEADEKIPILLETNVAHRGLSIEPWLEDIELTRLVMPGTARNDFGDATLSPLRIQAGHYSIGDISPLEWIIVGCESGAKRRPCPIEGVRRTVRDCQAAKVPVWVKQLSLHGCRKCRFEPCIHLHGHKQIDIVSHDPADFPEDLRIQEKP